MLICQLAQNRKLVTATTKPAQNIPEIIPCLRATGIFPAHLVASWHQPNQMEIWMSIKVTAPLVNGDLWDPLDENASGENAVELICGDDLRPPPTSVVITVTTESGKRVEVWIPNSGSSTASVRVDGKSV
ncbi:hypothetical protein [Pseudomonas khavaziana]|uniref:hypothetical protein n=2 Tax=Pseudomonas TaxID=286 RepID=UPI001C3D0E56|nr:hypothetical protein [Pseudomonas khavaziana]MBV4480074.1 hypothetical protein [Pseudomonas khavaziana]